MPNSPQRPFVPKRKPTENGAPAPEAGFRVAPPFVHGQAPRSAQPAPIVEQSQPVASISDFLAAEEPAEVQESVATVATVVTAETVGTAWIETPSIADFAAPEAAAEHTATGPANEPADEYELPPIEHFLDPITAETASAADRYDPPSEDPFTDEATPAAHSYDLPPEEPFAELAPPSVADEHGWEETDWQRYDWRSAAALGEAGDPAANTAWAETDWDNPTSGKRARESAAQAIADALDGIARRIRDGDLVMPQPPAAVPDPATIAATLAALLGVRR